MNRRIMSILLTVLMIIGLMPNELNAEEISNKVYEYDNYTAEYTITDSWDNSQNISITIENTGDTLIENWMLSYDFCGDIAGIWNATVETDSNGSKYIKNAGYNNVIETGKSVEFGYTLNNAEGMPEKMMFV